MNNYITIYRTGLDSVRIKPDKSNELEQKLMTHDYIDLSFDSTTCLNLNVGDFIIHNDNKYTINTPVEEKKEGSNDFSYNCKFEGPFHVLEKVQCMLNNSGTVEFTGTATEFLNLFVQNLNRDYGGYTAGGAEETDTVTITFENQTILSAIQSVCDELDIEFSLVDKVLYLQETGTSLDYTFKVGRYQGAYNLNRKAVDSSKIITRLWAFGSEQNLPSDYRDGLTKLIFANSDLNDEGRVENNIKKYGLCEACEDFDIYPTRTGTISAIDEDNIRLFIDEDMDFDLNDYLLDGENPKVYFKTGNLAGFTFDCSYDHDSKTYTLDPYTEGEISYPNDTMKPAVGDTYHLIDIYLPDSYIEAAETALRTAADEYIAKYSIPRITYELELDPMWLRMKSISFKIGDYIIIVDEDYGIEGLLRITSIKRNIRNSYECTIEVGELSSGSILSQLNKNLKATSKNVTNITNNTYSKTETNTVINSSKAVWQ